MSHVLKLLEVSESSLAPLNSVEKVEIQQYLEYSLIYASHLNNHQNVNTILQVGTKNLVEINLMLCLLKELNGLLSLKTYLVGYRLTVADILLYYILWNVLVSINIYLFKLHTSIFIVHFKRMV